MEVTINDLGDSRKKVIITVKKEEIREKYDEKVNELSVTAHIKGFRPGRVPKNVIERKFGAGIIGELKAQFITQGFQDAMKDHDLKPIIEPEFPDEQEIVMKKDSDFEFEFVVETQPEFELPQYKELEAKKTSPRVSSKDVESALNGMRRSKAELIPVEDKETQTEEGDIIICDVNLKVEDKLVWGEENYPLEVSDTEIAGIAITKKMLTGKKVDDTFSKKMTLPKDFKIEEYQDKASELTLTIAEIKNVKLPELDEAFAKEAGFDDIEKLKKKLREDIKAQKEASTNFATEQDLFKKIMDEAKITFPKSFLKQRIDQTKAGMRKQMEAEGKSKDKIEAHIKKQHDKIKKQITQQLLEYLIIDRIAEQENIEASDSDVEVYLKAIAMQQGRWPNEIKEAYEQRGLLDEIKHQVKSRKVLTFIRENAKRI